MELRESDVGLWTSHSWQSPVQSNTFHSEDGETDTKTLSGVLRVIQLREQ
jgi:hypothetical protein